MQNDVLAGEAVNTLGVMALQCGEHAEARAAFLRALALGGHSRELRARAEHNLGILAPIHGDLEDALAHYKRSLEEYRAAADAHGCALAVHNLGMASRYQGLSDAADRYYAHRQGIPRASGDAQ